MFCFLLPLFPFPLCVVFGLGFGFGFERCFADEWWRVVDNGWLYYYYRFANATSGVTWGGQTYETSDGKVEGTLNVTTVPVSEGVVVHDTEAVMLTFS